MAFAAFMAPGRLPRDRPAVARAHKPVPRPVRAGRGRCRGSATRRRAAVHRGTTLVGPPCDGIADGGSPPCRVTGPHLMRCRAPPPNAYATTLWARRTLLHRATANFRLWRRRRSLACLATL